MTIDEIQQILITDIYPWVYEQIDNIKQNGRKLTEHEKNIAKSAGVENIDSVIVLYTDFEFPYMNFLNQAIKDSESYTKLNALTLGHYILISDNLKEDILINQLRHVAQAEMFDNVEDFIEFYIMELVKFGYGNGPFESDASSFAFITKLKLRKYGSEQL